MKITLPLSLVIPRKTKADKIFSLNLNVYRNAHHMVLNDAKARWKGIVEDAIHYWQQPDNGYKAPLHFTYTVFPGNNRAFDLANVLPIVQKFTDDALIDAGIISDDNFKVVRAIDYRFGGVDKERPRVELEIRPMEDAQQATR